MCIAIMIAVDLEILHKTLTALLNDCSLNGGSVLRRHRFVLAHMQLKSGTPSGEIVLHAAPLRLPGIHALEDVFKRPFAEWDPHGKEHLWIEVDFSQIVAKQTSRPSPTTTTSTSSTADSSKQSDKQEVSVTIQTVPLTSWNGFSFSP